MGVDDATLGAGPSFEARSGGRTRVGASLDDDDEEDETQRTVLLHLDQLLDCAQLHTEALQPWPQPSPSCAHPRPPPHRPSSARPRPPPRLDQPRPHNSLHTPQDLCHNTHQRPSGDHSASSSPAKLQVRPRPPLAQPPRPRLAHPLSHSRRTRCPPSRPARHPSSLVFVPLLLHPPAAYYYQRQRRRRVQEAPEPEHGPPALAHRLGHLVDHLVDPDPLAQPIALDLDQWRAVEHRHGAPCVAHARPRSRRDDPAQARCDRLARRRPPARPVRLLGRT